MLLVTGELGGKALQLQFKFSRGICSNRRVLGPDAMEKCAKNFGDGTLHSKWIVWVEFALIQSSCKKQDETPGSEYSKVSLTKEVFYQSFCMRQTL